MDLMKRNSGRDVIYHLWSQIAEICRKLNLCGIKPTAQNQFGNLFVVDCLHNCCLVLTCFHLYSHFPINFIILVKLT